MHIALGRTENDAVPNHLPPPLQLIFRFNNNNNRPKRRTETFSSPTKASELIEKYSPGWLVYVVSCSSHSTKLRSLPKVSFPFGRAPPPPFARRVLHSRKTPATFSFNFITFPSQRGNPTRLCHRYRLYNREKERYFSMRVKVNRASW